MIKVYFIIVSLLIFLFVNKASAFFTKNLPKTKELNSSVRQDEKDNTSKDKKVKDEIKQEDGSQNVESLSEESEETESEEIQKIDPSENYKLIAIYLLNKQPRALIKDLTNPYEVSKEYKVGDFIDELQTFSISKILFTPTIRIELTDNFGFSYIIKPQSIDTTKDRPKTSTGTKTIPTYFASPPSKPKIKKQPPATQELTSTKETHDEKKGETKSPQDATGKKEETPTQVKTTIDAATLPQQTQSTSLQGIKTGTSQSVTPPADKDVTNLKPTDPLGRDRPTNPFEESKK